MFILSTCFLGATIPPVCGVCASLITWICEGTYDGEVWSFLSSCWRQKWKTTGWKDPLAMRFWDYSTIELLFISLTLWMVSEIKSKTFFWAIWHGVTIFSFSINNYHKLLSRSGPVRTITKWIIMKSNLLEDSNHINLLRTEPNPDKSISVSSECTGAWWVTDQTMFENPWGTVMKL